MNVMPRPLVTRAAVLVVTAVCIWLTVTRLTISSDLSALFPTDERSAALARFTRVFGGGDLGVVLVRGNDAVSVERAAREAATELATRASVVRVLDRAPSPPRSGAPDPTLAWLHAGPSARARLASIVTPEGMHARLMETRALLLAPGSSDAEEWLALDPLRLFSVPWETSAELAAGVTPGIDGTFVADDGRARLLVLEPRGRAFEGTAAATFVREVEGALSATVGKIPGVHADLTGGHAIAKATETMLRRDLIVSSAVSTALAALTFLLTFRRARALVAVLPPLALGTVWTTGAATLVTHGLSAISIAFSAVVVGVGVDTGVHVYAALLEGRRQGLAPREAATYARRTAWRPTLLAATIAGFAFGSLALSDLVAMRQLGILCGIGEVLTAISILLVTPDVGAWLERGPPPPAPRPKWLALVAAITATRARAAIALGVTLLGIVVILCVGWVPSRGNALVAIRPRGLAPLAVYDEIYRLFGGRPGQWVILSVDTDPDRAATRADTIAEALEPLLADHTIEGFDALASYAPAPATQRARLEARDALDLPRRDLRAALDAAGFDAAECARALNAFAHPSHATLAFDRSPSGPLAWLTARHLRSDGRDTLAVTYVRPTGDSAKDARARRAIEAADPAAIVTGFPQLEESLEQTLTHDLPRIGLAALVLVAFGLFAALRRLEHVILALLALICELAILGISMRVLHLHWHVYDALVVPVLIGITLDESIFLLHAAATGGEEHARVTQGPLVAATALTTAAGFGALLSCRFEGLFDLGAVGALGSVAGLIAALVIVPAGLRLSARNSLQA